MSESSQLYRQLIAGDIIDKISSASNYERLCDDYYLQATNDWLAKLEMQCIKLASGAGFYAIYTDSQNRMVKQQATQLFKEFSKNLKPLVLWLGICLHTQNDRPLQAGDVLNQSDLLASLEQSVHLQEQLKDIIKVLQRSNPNHSPKEQLTSLLDYLEKERYFVKQGSSGAVYTATAKWDFLYENLAIIAQYENFALDDETIAINNQPELGL